MIRLDIQAMARPRTVQLEALFDSLPAAASEILQTNTHTFMDVCASIAPSTCWASVASSRC